MFGIIKKMFIVSLSSIVNASNHAKFMSFSLLLLIYILMNSVKSFTTIHLKLDWTNVLEVVTHPMTYLIKYVFQIKQKI